MSFGLGFELRTHNWKNPFYYRKAYGKSLEDFTWRETYLWIGFSILVIYVSYGK